jgi:hypothetical protein
VLQPGPMEVLMELLTANLVLLLALALWKAANR